MYRLLINNNKCTIKSISKWEESEVQLAGLEWENIFELPLYSMTRILITVVAIPDLI